MSLRPELVPPPPWPSAPAPSVGTPFESPGTPLPFGTAEFGSLPTTPGTTEPELHAAPAPAASTTIARVPHTVFELIRPPKEKWKQSIVVDPYPTTFLQEFPS